MAIRPTQWGRKSLSSRAKRRISAVRPALGSTCNCEDPSSPVAPQDDKPQGLLEANPELQAQALYYLGYAYESGYPANHHGAIEALSKAAALQSSWKSQADELLGKVKKAASE